MDGIPLQIQIHALHISPTQLQLVFYVFSTGKIFELDGLLGEWSGWDDMHGG